MNEKKEQQSVGEDKKCSCVKGIGLWGMELGVVEDCPIHGKKSSYNPPEYTYDSDNAD